MSMCLVGEMDNLNSNLPGLHKLSQCIIALPHHNTLPVELGMQCGHIKIGTHIMDTVAMCV